MPVLASEARLVERLRAGDEAAYRELLDAHGGRMYGTAIRLLGNSEDARDVLQEAFLSAFKAAACFDGRSSLGTWLHRIVVNAALMRLRSRSRREKRDVEYLLPRFGKHGCFVEPQAEWRELPEEPALRAELRAQVRNAIAGLPASLRSAVMLRDIEGFSLQRVAEHLGISINAAKIRVHRARQALRTLLAPQMA